VYLKKSINSKLKIDYVELHSHSYFSLLDGAVSPEALVEAAGRAGMLSLALTDHDGLYGIPAFFTAAKRAGVKPILGAELTLEGGHHVTLLVMDGTGYANLCRLITQAQLSPENELTQNSRVHGFSPYLSHVDQPVHGLKISPACS
jgi:error-prone DNA polymerase